MVAGRERTRWWSGNQTVLGVIDNVTLNIDLQLLLESSEVAINYSKKPKSIPVC
jgi:hypothetical protein